MKKLAIILLVLLIGLGLLMGYSYFFVDGSWYGSMPHHGYFTNDWTNAGFFSFMMIRGLLMFGLFIGFIVLVVMFFMKEQHTVSKNSSLDNRLARGEISLEEYKEIKNELGKGQ